MNIITETRYDAIREAIRGVQASLYKDMVGVTSSADMNNDYLITWGVNWSCCGPQEP